ncbi:MAG: ACP S-malonyltransferase [Erysipelotrichaceae bacterium]
MKTAFLFAGQGAQQLGMGLDFYNTYPLCKELYDSIQIDFDLKEVCFNGPLETLNNTAYTQACLLVTCYAIAKALEYEGFKADVTAGLSLGEYSALTYSQVFSLQDAVNLVRQRGQIMAKAMPEGTCGMLAVLSTQHDLILQLCNNSLVTSKGLCEIANYNSLSQVVVSGNNAALSELEELFKQNSVRYKRLNVSGAFHTSLLKPASLKLKVVLESTPFKPAIYPVYMNVSGKPETNIQEALIQQLYSSVQWIKIIQQMLSDGVDTFIEIGPAKVLSALVRNISPSSNIVSIDSVSALQALKGEWHV